jgi:hypothetical protein
MKTRFGSSLTWAALVACGLSHLAGTMVFAQQDIETTMQFSSSTILLGEPVWVLVTARNVSQTELRFNPGDYCFFESKRPVTAVVPGATAGTGKPERCEYGSAGGDCFEGGSTTDLAAGGSATWRYLLEGNFHFTHAGAYTVQLTSHPGRPFRAGNDKTLSAAPAELVTQTLTLEVTPRDDAALLAREKQMAADLEAEILTRRSPPSPADRDASFREMQNIRQIRSGLAAQPAPGMESVFQHWLQLPNDFESDAITGLKNLNTKESRAALAKIAETPNKPNSYIEEAATYALDEMGDVTYFSLMVQLMASPNERVQRAAIRGAGALGGDAAVPVLLEKMRAAANTERNDAMSALGDTKSRAAVKALIDLSGGKGNDYQNAWWPLFVLTHHSLPKVTYLRTAEQTHDAWQRWWDAGGKNALVYSPYECAPKEDQ